MVVATLAGCGEPVNDPSAGMSVPGVVALIDGAPRSEVRLAELVEAFAFGARSTQAQRDALVRDVVGHTVCWDLPVGDVGYSEGRFVVTSLAIPTSNRSEAVPVLRVMAWVLPRDHAEQELMMRLKADDVIRVRGIVQEIRNGRIAAIVPAVVGTEAGSR